MADGKPNETDTFDREFAQARLKTWPPVKLVRTDICQQHGYLSPLQCWLAVLGIKIFHLQQDENFNIFPQLGKTLIAAFMGLS